MRLSSCSAVLLVLLAGCSDKGGAGDTASGGGADATDGTDGADGADGTDGTDGTDGVDGSDGTGGPTGKCEESNTTPVESMDVAAGSFDFSIRAVMLSVGGDWRGSFTDGEGVAVDATLGFVNDAYEMEFVEFEWVAEDPDAEPETCAPAYRFRTPLALQTSDGRLAEDTNALVEATFINEANLRVTLPSNTLTGSLRPADIEPGLWAETSFVLDMQTPTGSSWMGGAVFTYPGDDEGAEPLFENIGEVAFDEQTPFE